MNMSVSKRRRDDGVGKERSVSPSPRVNTRIPARFESIQQHFAVLLDLRPVWAGQARHQARILSLGCIVSMAHGHLCAFGTNPQR